MNSHHLRAVLILLLVAGVSCSGGGGGSGGAAFAGTWRGQLLVTENSCRGPVENFSSTDIVNQDGDRIVLEVESGTTYEGFTTSDTSFLVTRQDERQCFDIDTGELVPGSTLVLVRTTEYSNVQGNEAHVTFTYDEGNCTSNTGDFSNACRIVSKGVFQRDPSV